jgi:ribulose-phosphate 3-epimerase
MKMIKIAPALFSGDPLNLLNELERVSNADLIHFDVMDGNFTPEITSGFNTIYTLKEKSKKPFDLHLLISNPLKHLQKFSLIGDIITVHQEVLDNISKAINIVKEKNKRFGLALIPKTPLSKVVPYLREIDMVVIMTIDPTIEKANFDDSALAKIEELKNICQKKDINIDIQVDGKIDIEKGRLAVSSGANILVSGSFIFKSQDPQKTISKMKKELSI